MAPIAEGKRESHSARRNAAADEAWGLHSWEVRRDVGLKPQQSKS
jgi:hypothetical protein